VLTERRGLPPELGGTGSAADMFSALRDAL
jgi:hypothetical protein